MKINELLREDEGTAKLEAWKKAVKAKWPKVAPKLKYKSYIEGDNNVISAQVPDEDRSYGVFDLDTLEGEVYDEAE